MLRRIAVATVLLGLLGTLALPVGVGIAAQRLSAAPAPVVKLEVGATRLIVYATLLPRCNPDGLCPEFLARAAGAQRRYLVAWLIYPRKAGTRWPLNSRQLLTIPLPE
jgi:hypothetical protein